MKKSYTRVLSLLIVLYMSATALFAQTLTLSFSGTPPYSAGEVFTVNARVSGAGVKNSDDFQIEIICPDCQGTQVQTCDIIDATAMDGGTCLTPPVFTAPVDSFYGFQISGFCRVSNPPGVNNFLPCSAAIILPVELGAFSANYNNNQVELEWQMLSEINKDHFEVEHSLDSYRFQSIGMVKGAGTSLEAKNYFYFHRIALSGTHYYRLKQVNTDGTFDYSKVVAVVVDNAGQLSLFPNPVKDVIYVQQNGLDLTNHFQLMDTLGRKLDIATSASNGLYQIRLPANLPRGNYWLKIERSGKLETVHVVKE